LEENALKVKIDMTIDGLLSVHQPADSNIGTIANESDLHTLHITIRVISIRAVPDKHFIGFRIPDSNWISKCISCRIRIPDLSKYSEI